MIEITMPRLSDTMEEGAIATWHKQPGDKVEVGDILVEIETDKATMEYEAYEAGTMSKILVAEGENVSIGTPIALIDDGADAGAPAAPATTPDAGRVASASERIETPDAGRVASASERIETPVPGLDTRAPSSLVTRPTEGAGDGERQFASPYVRKLARDHNLDLSNVRGTGPGGRIIRTDLDGLLAPGAEATQAPSAVAPTAAAAALAAPAPARAVSPTAGAAPAGGAPAPTSADEKRGSESVPMTKTRRVIARRLGESARTIPHFYVTAVANAEALMQLRADLNTQLTASGRPKVSVNDLLIRASALALREHPLVNASYIDDTSETMQVHHRVNIGVAVASENGLVVPVIPDADTKTVTQLGVETKQLVALANDKKLTLEQMSGGTFTISNLGMFGVEQFTAIINPPEGAILAVGGTKREPTVVGDEILPRYQMRYTLSADHRIVDGALAAQFLQSLTRLIENPWTIIA
ncbi:dihydrolipoamide acetyltransferase family protein [Rathayibacter soli]|uniref:dihydrolipoamide acetyltransferase family protein n=1 Tax=Rathayibacter soli TaxID=3144168 RepID=UPI0027E506C2|nr:dihydrolipoamide acetyltransferase family protein [Glaciibacter superstes]